MTTIQDLITAGRLALDTPVVGVPVFTEDRHLILDSASLLKATPHGVERVVAMSCEGFDDDDVYRPSLFARCYAMREAADAVMPELVAKRAEARRVWEERKLRDASASGRAADGRGTAAGPTSGTPASDPPSSRA